MKNYFFLMLLLTLLVGCSGYKNLNNKSFSEDEVQLIMDADSLKPMRVYKITSKTDSILLRKQSGYVKPNPSDVVLQTFVKRLFATVRDSMSLGVGIAAPQVGVLKILFVYNVLIKKTFLLKCI